MAAFKINEIFTSIQGEGHWTGTPAVFVRFAGCNMRCPFCDTRHDNATVMSASQIAVAIHQHLNANEGVERVVFTGGEPTLQDFRPILAHCAGRGWSLHLETNGTEGWRDWPDAPTRNELEDMLDWVTVSPKAVPGWNIWANEIKLVFPTLDPAEVMPRIMHIEHRFLQPKACESEEKTWLNIRGAIAYARQHAGWRVSPQMHKLLKVQ